MIFPVVGGEATLQDLVAEYRQKGTSVDSRKQTRVIRHVYEACVFQALRERLRCKEIWVVGAHEWRNPDAAST